MAKATFDQRSLVTKVSGILVSGILVSGASVSAVRANIFQDITDAVVGHTRDIVGRFGADEVLPDAEILRTGSFRSDDPGNDAAHHGEGKVSIVKKGEDYYVQFHPDFSSAFAPDPTIYVSSVERVFDNNSFAASDRQNLGKLAKGSGASYTKIQGYDGASVNSVTIWCERFGVFITSATVE